MPFKRSGISYAYGQIRYGKVWLSLWDSCSLKDYELGPGTISEDARGRWYINICATPKQRPQEQMVLFNDSIGIDLGLKDFAATSDGAVSESRKFYRALEAKPASAQRAYKKTGSRQSTRGLHTGVKIFITNSAPGWFKAMLPSSLAT